MIRFKIINLHELSRCMCNNSRSSLLEFFLKKKEAAPKIYNNFISEKLRAKVVPIKLLSIFTETISQYECSAANLSHTTRVLILQFKDWGR